MHSFSISIPWIKERGTRERRGMFCENTDAVTIAVTTGLVTSNYGFDMLLCLWQPFVQPTILTLQLSFLGSKVTHEAVHLFQFCFCLIQLVFKSATEFFCICLMEWEQRLSYSILSNTHCSFIFPLRLISDNLTKNNNGTLVVCKQKRKPWQ